MEISRFPNKLKKYRRCAGYSQKKVARILGLTNTSVISRWEQGEILPGTKHLFRLSRLYDTLPHLLFEDLWNQFSWERSLLTSAEVHTHNATTHTMHT